ncbi:MAG: serine/threonine-protein kinase, partial [Pirellulaceae bacterium]|nr:serine/threonine-protein kinase [Pirellulaceae bacterium]
MNVRPAMLENNMQPTQPGDPSQPNKPPDQIPAGGSGSRFTYPSGSRPLEGYTLKRGIGIGGFGEVYFALSDAGKEVALKRIQRNLDIELRGVRQCLNLKHVNLIQLWDIRTNERGESWVVMEYVPGASLRDVIERYPQGLPEDQLREWFESIASGVTYLHGRGIVHRDLKPGNIFRDDDEQVVKIGDYGLSKFISCSNRDGQTESVGTFHYMAPEIGKGVYGREIDVYALGIILFEMMTGRVPFEGESSQEIIMKHLTADPNISGIAQPYGAVIRKALAKDPERRFRDVPEMLEALRGNATIEPPVVVPPARSTPPIPPIQPMFIDDSAASDADISFGEMKESPISSSGSHQISAHQKTQVAHDNVHAITDEPIARAVKGGWEQFTDWWMNANLTTPVKALVLAGAGLLLAINSAWLLPVCSGLGALYLVYFVVRSLLPARGPRKPTRASKDQMIAVWRSALANRPISDRVTEGIGSLVVAAIVCMILGFLTLLTTAQSTGDVSQQWAFYAWNVGVAVVASWSLIVTSKTWEHRTGDPLVRRFVMLSLGVVVGLFAYAFAEFLHLDWTAQAWPGDPKLSPFDAGLVSLNGAPRFLGMMLFFQGVFVILRWWKQADPLRRTRLSIWNVGLCLLWGILMGQLFQFPLPWSAVLAV